MKRLTDLIARLWSTQTYSNLVCYKGHNYPIWDVDFGPHGFYFATASNDRTARLWSCDHIHPLRIFAGHLSDVDVCIYHMAIYKGFGGMLILVMGLDCEIPPQLKILGDGFKRSYLPSVGCTTRHVCEGFHGPYRICKNSGSITKWSIDGIRR